MLIIFLLVFFLGCSSAHFNPRSVTQKVAIPSRYSVKSDILLLEKGINIGCWWKRFKDPKLERFIHLLTKKSLDLQIANFKVLEAKANLEQTSSYLYPHLDLGFRAEREKINYNIHTPFGREITASETSTTYSTSLSVSYEIDLWKKLRNFKKASFAELVMTEEEKRTLIQSIICEFVKNYIKIAALNKKIELLLAKKNIEKKILEVAKQRFKRGEIGYELILELKNKIDLIQEEIAVTQKDVSSLIQECYVLLGEYPKPFGIHPTIDLIKFKVWKIPAGIPADLVFRRPDIRAEMAKVRASFYLKEKAKANFFPSLTLTGSLGFISEEFRKMISSENFVWKIAGALVQPIFRGKEIIAKYKKAKFSYKEEVSRCTKKILIAFKEVERGLLNYEEEVKRETFVKNRISNLKEKLYILNERFKRGLCSVTDVLNTEEELIDSKIELVQIKSNIILNHIYLYKSLGGDWDRGCH